MITAIEWVSELIEVAGGVPLFANAAREKGAQERIVTGEMVCAGIPSSSLRPVRQSSRLCALVKRPGFDQSGRAKQAPVRNGSQYYLQRDRRL